MNILKKGLMVVGGLCIGAFSINALQDAPTDENIEKKIINDYNVYALQVPEKLDFAGEPLPLENPDILRAYGS